MADLFRRGGYSSLSISDARQRILLTSDGHLDILGRSAADVVGHSWLEWLTPADRGVFLPAFEAFLRNKRSYEVVGRIVRPDGQAVPVMVRCSNLLGADASETLVFCEMRILDEIDHAASPERFACAEYVRDITYELAAHAGRHRLRGLTQALVEASATADQALETLDRIAGAMAPA